MTQPTAAEIAEALAEQLLPEWEIVEGPMHATPAFRFPVYASKCRPAVAQALQVKDAKIAALEIDLERARGLIMEAAAFVSQRMCNPNEFVIRLRAAAGEQVKS